MSLPILDFPFYEPYSTKLEFKTNIVERFQGEEQRKPTQFCAVRTFTFPLSLTPTQRSLFEDFFMTLKGSAGAFLWTWDASIGGNNQTYKCWFCDDQLEESILHYGYSQGSVSFQTVETANVLKNRFFAGIEQWDCCTLDYNPETRFFTNNTDSQCRIKQTNVLQKGQPYRFFGNLQTSNVVTLSEAVADLDIESRYLHAGYNALDFVAASNDFEIVLEQGAELQISDIGVYPAFDMAKTLPTPALVEHTFSMRYSTLKDTLLTSQNRRISMFDAPRRRWLLTFEKNYDDFRALEDFFLAKKGSFKAFDWTWDVEHGGDGAAYNVRFDSDTFEAQRDFYGYGHARLPLVEVL